MSNPVRDRSPAQSELGLYEESVGKSGRSDKGKGDEGLGMVSGQTDRLRILVEKLMFVYGAGQTRRWHAMQHVIRTETVAAHTWNVVMWIIILHPNPSMGLLRAALVHDIAEFVTGDMPRWIKEKAGVREMMHTLEDEVLAGQGLAVDITVEDQQWLDAVDLFDAWLFLRQNLLAGNRLVTDSYQRATNRLKTMTEPKEVHEVFLFLQWGEG